MQAGTCQPKGLAWKEQKHQQLAHLALRGSNEESFLVSAPNLQQMGSILSSRCRNVQFTERSLLTSETDGTRARPRGRGVLLGAYSTSEGLISSLII